jgi:transcriptional regulator with XRE-family HTH domain
VNENLRRALLRARITEEDVATQLEVDPKTVRRWLEGRVPYLRHRWALAGLLGLDEVDLWPEMRAALAARSRPEEIRAIYPGQQAIPRDLWRRLFSSAVHEIGILEDSGLLLAGDASFPHMIASKARAGVSVRICLAVPEHAAIAEPGNSDAANSTTVPGIRQILGRYQPLREVDGVQIRLHHAVLYNSIYRADDQLLISQRAFGIPPMRTPVLRLQGTEEDDMVIAYLGTFERVWASAEPLD